MKRGIKKGSLGEDQMMLIAMLILIFVLAIFLASSQGGTGSWISDSISKFCMNNPQFCGSMDKESPIYLKAKNSVNYLGCALEAVSKGSYEVESCKPQAASDAGSALTATMAIIAKFSEPGLLKFTGMAITGYAAKRVEDLVL